MYRQIRYNILAVIYDARPSDVLQSKVRAVVQVARGERLLFALERDTGSMLDEKCEEKILERVLHLFTGRFPTLLSRP